jgi:hypothetical protein
VEQSDITRKLLSRRNLWQEIWTYLPIWFLYLEGLGLHNIYMANAPDQWFAEAGISRSWFALLMLPVSLWFYAYYRIRLRESVHEFDRRRVHRYVLGAVFGLPFAIWALYAVLPFLRVEVSTRTLDIIFEVSNLVWALLIMAHTWYFRGLPRFVTFFVVAFVYGMLLENAGIYMGFFFEPQFSVYVGKLPAPLATMIGWCIVFTCCITLAEFFRARSARLTRSPALTALLTTAIALSTDGQLDPLASFPGMWWHWNETLSPWWFGVPFCNYAAWFGAFFAFSYLYFLLFDRDDLTVWQKNTRLAVLVPSISVFAGALWLALMLVYETLFDAGGARYATIQILSDFFDKIWPYAV